MERTKNVKGGFLVGGLNQFIGIVFPFIIRTIMIKRLGNEYLGLNSLFTSILQVLSLSELGFGVAISYLLYEPIAKKNLARTNAILNFYRLVYRIIGVTIIAIAIVVTPFLPGLTNGEFPPNINLYALFWIYVANTSVSYFLFGYKRALLSADQRYDIEMMISIVAALLRYALQIIALLIFENYYLYAIVIPIGTIFDNIFSAIIVGRRYPWCSPSGKLEKNEIRIVIKNTGGALCSKIGTTIYLSADSIVISSFLGLFVLGTYNNYYYIINMFTMLFAVVHNAVRPAIGNYWVTEGREKNWTLYKMINTGYMSAANVVCACCFSLLYKFEILWGGQNNSLGSNIVLYLVLCFFINKVTSIPALYLEATGILWKGKLVPLISAIFNLFLNIILVQIVGLDGVLLSSILAAIIINIPGYIWVLQKTIFEDKAFVRYSTCFFFRHAVQMVFATLFCYCIDTFFFKDNTWVNFFAEVILLVIVSTTIIVLMNAKNKDFRKLFRYIANRRK